MLVLWINMRNFPPKNEDTFLILSLFYSNIFIGWKRKLIEWIHFFLLLQLNRYLRIEFKFLSDFKKTYLEK